MQIIELEIDLDTGDIEVLKGTKATFIESHNMTISIRNDDLEPLIAALENARDTPAPNGPKRVVIRW